MGKAGFIIGLLSIIGLLIAFIPCLGWMYWAVLPLALLGLIFSIIGFSDPADKSQATTGIILCAITLVFGTIRWVLGGFIL